jgi:hypothetical protein
MFILLTSLLDFQLQLTGKSFQAIEKQEILIQKGKTIKQLIMNHA